MLCRHTKDAAVEVTPVVYDRIPREVFITGKKENGIHMWQQKWTNTEKGAVTTVFFPVIVE